MSIKSMLTSTTTGVSSVIDLFGNSATMLSKELQFQASTRDKARAVRLETFKEDLKVELLSARESTKKQFDKSILSEEEINKVITDVENCFK